MFFFNVLCSLISFGFAIFTEASITEVLARNSFGLRIFHPAFPLEILNPVSMEELERIEAVKKAMGSNEKSLEESLALLPKKGLPWSIMPNIGITEEQKVWSKSEVTDSFQSLKHTGFLVWAAKIDKPKAGCFLMNHWKQEVILLLSYDPIEGARGVDVQNLETQSNPDVIFWPPSSLEFELMEKKWQCVEVSENISSGEVFAYLPPQMKKAPWELLFVLLISSQSDPDCFQSMFDTGLCPQRGLIAYMRLLQQVLKRTEIWEGVPPYRKIVESDIKM